MEYLSIIFTLHAYWILQLLVLKGIVCHTYETSSDYTILFCTCVFASLLYFSFFLLYNMEVVFSLTIVQRHFLRNKFVSTKGILSEEIVRTMKNISCLPVRVTSYGLLKQMSRYWFFLTNVGKFYIIMCLLQINILYILGNTLYKWKPCRFEKTLESKHPLSR